MFNIFDWNHCDNIIWILKMCVKLEKKLNVKNDLHLSDAFIQSNLQWYTGYIFFYIMCVPWESNPQPFALQTQCSTTETHCSVSIMFWVNLTHLDF